MNITREQFEKLAKKHLTALKGYDINETIEIYGVGELYDDIVESGNMILDTEKIKSVEIKDPDRCYINFKRDLSLEVKLQDKGKSLKVFISEKNQEIKEQ